MYKTFQMAIMQMFQNTLQVKNEHLNLPFKQDNNTVMVERSV